MFNLETLLTQKVRAEFIGRGRYRILPEKTDVDALLDGEVLSAVAHAGQFYRESARLPVRAHRDGARSSCATFARTRCCGRIPSWSSARNTRRTERHERDRSGGVFRTGHQRARTHEPRLRADDRQLHPRGVLVPHLMPVESPPPFVKQIASGRAGSGLPAPGEDDVEKSALSRSSRSWSRTVCGPSTSSASMSANDDRRSARRRRDVAGRGGAHAADDVTLARGPRVPGGDDPRAEARERGGDARPGRVRSLLEAARIPRPFSSSWPSTLDKRGRMLQAAARSRRPSSSAERSRIRLTPSAGSGRGSRRRRRRSSPQPPGCLPNAPASTSSACATMSTVCCCTRSARRWSQSPTWGDRGAGGAAGRLGHDQCHRAGDGEALRQLALMLDAGAPPEKLLGQLGWLVRTKFPAIAPGEFTDASTRCSGRTSTSSAPLVSRGCCWSGWSSNYAGGRAAAGARL